MSSEKIVCVSWSEIHRALGVLANRVLSDEKPDALVLIAKGGLIPGRILADFIKVDDMGFVEVKFYRGIGVRGERPYLKFTMLPPLTNRDVLIVDDVVDSGRTMQLVVEYISSFKARSIRTLAIYVKPWSSYIPDYYYAQIDKWVVFPWEICEAVREGVIDRSAVEELSRYCEM